MPDIAVECLPVGPHQANCYLVENRETGELFLVDAGGGGEEIIRVIGDRKPVAVLATHGHYDHIAAVPEIIAANGCAAVYCTAAPRDALIKKGVNGDRLRIIKPGGLIPTGPFTIRVLKGKHIVFDKRLMLKTLFSPRVPARIRELSRIVRDGRGFGEAGETVVYHITINKNNILLLGSLNLDCIEEYPLNADLLVLPFQGRSDISGCAINIVRRLRPKKVLLDHFDDAFPPVSSYVDANGFETYMAREFPDIPVIVPRAGDWINIE